MVCVWAKSLPPCPTLCDSGLWSLCPWDFPGKNPGVGWHALLQGSFPTQGSNSHLWCHLHWKAGSLPLTPLVKPLGAGDEITNYEEGEFNCQDCYLCREMTNHFHLEGQPRCISCSDQECSEQHFECPLRVNRKDSHDQVVIFPKLGRKRWSRFCQKLLLTGELTGPPIELTEWRME